MVGVAREALLGIRTVAEMIEAFDDEERCRRLLEAMVWPHGRVCPACGYKRSIALAGRDMGQYRARPGLYQCSNGACCFQFTVTTRTPLHATKLPLSTWLKALWLILQSDKGLSSIRLAEALGVSQPTAWRIGHALRLMLARESPLGGTVEIDELFLGGRPKKRIDEPPPGRGRKGLRRTTKQQSWRWCSGPARPRGPPPPAMPGPQWSPISRWMKSNACSRKRRREGVCRCRPELRRARDRSACAPRICSRPSWSRASISGCTARWPVSFITSAPSKPTSISTKSAFAGCQDRIDDPGKRIQLRTRRRPASPVPGRHRKTPASWPPSAGQSQNDVLLPAGSPLQSEPQNEPERIDGEGAARALVGGLQNVGIDAKLLPNAGIPEMDIEVGIKP